MRVLRHEYHDLYTSVNQNKNGFSICLKVPNVTAGSRSAAGRAFQDAGPEVLKAHGPNVLVFDRCCDSCDIPCRRCCATQQSGERRCATDCRDIAPTTCTSELPLIRQSRPSAAPPPPLQQPSPRQSFVSSPHSAFITP